MNFFSSRLRMALAATAFFTCLNPPSPATAQDRDSPELTWQFYVDELKLESSLIFRGDDPLSPKDLAIRNLTVIDLPSGELKPHSALILSGGLIGWVGPEGDLDVPEGARVIDGGGRYLAPGLIDMHVHTLVTDANYLTQIGAGVTTIREMDGFPWLLTRKHQAERGELFAPTMFVAGTMLNQSDFGGYARTVNTPEEARQAVREQAAAGYEAIKIHNSLSIELFDAIMDEAAVQGLDVVGHNPQPVSVAHAIERGMRTAEHLKGYIDDAVLKISDDDWLTPSVGTGIYLAPTFYAYRDHLRGADALAVVNGNDGLMVHPRLRAQWRAVAADEVTALTKLRQNILPMKKQIFEKLLPHQMNWIAGTDSGSYNFMVPGPALVEEVQIFEKLGLSPLEALKTATTNAADAMRWSDRLGRIAPGLQADLILLDANPLETTDNLGSLRSVVLRGTWIEDADALLHRPATVWAGETVPASPPSHDEVAAHLEARRTLKAKGFAFNHYHLGELKELIVGFGYDDLAQEVDALSD